LPHVAPVPVLTEDEEDEDAEDAEDAEDEEDALCETLTVTAEEVVVDGSPPLPPLPPSPPEPSVICSAQPALSSAALISDNVRRFRT
jgi:hypothetical protein